MGYGRKHLTLSIVDDGMGFDVSEIAQSRPVGHWGLQGMHERAASLHARLTLSSRRGVGTALELEVPASIAFRDSSRKWHRWLDLVHMMFARRRSKKWPSHHDEP